MTATATGEVAEFIERRLREIEEQLKPFEELEQERRRLRQALGALRDETPAAPASRARRRAARGSNLTAILEYVVSTPGSTAGEIADATGPERHDEPQRPRWVLLRSEHAPRDEDRCQCERE